MKEFKEQIVLRFGTPEVFLSDNGTEFKNLLVDEYLASLGIFNDAFVPPPGESDRASQSDIENALGRLHRGSARRLGQKLAKIGFLS